MGGPRRFPSLGASLLISIGFVAFARVGLELAQLMSESDWSGSLARRLRPTYVQETTPDAHDVIVGEQPQQLSLPSGVYSVVKGGVILPDTNKVIPLDEAIAQQQQEPLHVQQQDPVTTNVIDSHQATKKQMPPPATKVFSSDRESVVVDRQPQQKPLHMKPHPYSSPRGGTIDAKGRVVGSNVDPPSEDPFGNDSTDEEKAMPAKMMEGAKNVVNRGYERMKSLFTFKVQKNEDDQTPTQNEDVATPWYEGLFKFKSSEGGESTTEQQDATTSVGDQDEDDQTKNAMTRGYERMKSLFTVNA